MQLLPKKIFSKIEKKPSNKKYFLATKINFVAMFFFANLNTKKRTYHKREKPL